VEEEQQFCPTEDCHFQICVQSG